MHFCVVWTSTQYTNLTKISHKNQIKHSFCCVCSFWICCKNYKFDKKCFSSTVMETDKKMSYEIMKQIVSKLLHMIISSMIQYWNITSMCIRFPQRQHWWLSCSFSSAKRIWEITWQITSKMHFCLVSLWQVVQICRKLCFWYILTKTNGKNEYL